MHTQVQQLEAQPRRVDLDQPENKPENSQENQQEKPPPDD
jgi:hypothetical protein